ncbi:MAG TPA: addiction module toxin, HicA family [Chitinophagaceae bacterium]|nr:addiction module toxin, HicA family [Chitinophagaceae bacterium]
MIKKVKEMIKLIELDGWYLHSQKGSHKHSIKKGRVTIPDHGKNDVLDHMIVKSILKQAGLL